MSFPKYENYQAIPEKYRFDLEAILEGESLETLFQKFEKATHQLLATKATYLQSLANFKAYLKISQEYDFLQNRISNYLNNWKTIDITNSKISQAAERFLHLCHYFLKKWGNETMRLYQNRDLVISYCSDPEVSPYGKDLQYQIAYHQYLLAPEIEQFLQDHAQGETDLSHIFNVLTDTELDFGFALSEDQKRREKISYGNRLLLLEDSDQGIRKSTYFNFNKGFALHKQTLAALLLAHFKKTVSLAKIRGFKSSVHSFLFADQIDIKLLDLIFKEISKRAPLLKKYHKARKKFFEAKFQSTYQAWDRRLNLVNYEQEFTVSEGQKIVLKALAPLGEEYLGVLKKAFSERWVDYYNVPKKRSGAYSISNSYNLAKKYIAMNWNFTLDSVLTLAHELGHSLHSYYSDTYQPYASSAYPIILAEIASTFNEHMLNDYLLKNETDEQKRFYLLESEIKTFQLTVFRQALFSEYEFSLYQALDQNATLSTFEDLQKLYQKAAQNYQFEVIEEAFEDSDKFLISASLPHFYYSFYVYKYSLGYIVASAFYQRYLKEGETALKNYINNFLKQGSSAWPAELLKASKINIYDSQIFTEAFQILEEKINEYISLGEKIFNIKV